MSTETKTKTETPITLTARTLHRALKAVSRAMSKPGDREHLARVRLETFEVPGSSTGRVGLRSVATNGHWLALFECELDGETTIEAGRILDLGYDQVWEIERHLRPFTKKSAADIEVTLSRKCFEMPGVTLLIRSCDELFPPYDKVIPTRPVFARRFGWVTVSADYIKTVAMTYKDADIGGFLMEVGTDESKSRDKKYDDLCPVVFFGESDCARLHCVLMPMRAERTELILSEVRQQMRGGAPTPEPEPVALAA